MFSLSLPVKFFSILQPLEDSSPRFFFSFPEPRTCALNASSSSGLILPGPEKVFAGAVEVGRSGVGVVSPSFSSLAQGLSEARLLFLFLGGGVEKKPGSFWCCCCCWWRWRGGLFLEERKRWKEVRRKTGGRRDRGWHRFALVSLVPPFSLLPFSFSVSNLFPHLLPQKQEKSPISARDWQKRAKRTERGRAREHKKARPNDGVGVGVVAVVKASNEK